MEKRVKILPGTEEQTGVGSPGAQPVRGTSDDLGKILAGHTRYRCINEDANVQPCNIIFPQSAYQVVVDHLSEDTSREHGGFLLGYEIYSGDSELPTVEVIQAVPARHTEGTPTRLTFTEETWRDLDQITDQYHELGQKLERVGWYHSHPNISIFLSHYDLDVCTIFDRRRYPIALVVDPVRKRGGFFVRGAHGYAPQSAQGFYEKHDMSKESRVQWTNMTRSLQAPALPPVRMGGTSAGAVERPHIRIETRKSPETRPGITLGRIALAMLLFVMAGALGLLTYDQWKTAQRLDELSAKLSNLERKPAGTEQPPAPESQNKPPVVDTPAQSSPAQGPNPAPATPTKVKLSIKPAGGNIKAGEVVQFTLSGVGSSSLRPKWAIRPSSPTWKFGKINAETGEYTPPSIIAGSRTVTIVAGLKPQPLHTTITLIPSSTRGGSGNTDSGTDDDSDVTIKNKGTTPGSGNSNGISQSNPAPTPEQKNSGANVVTAPATPATSPTPAAKPSTDQQTPGGDGSTTAAPTPKNTPPASNDNPATPTKKPATTDPKNPGTDHKGDPLPLPATRDQNSTMPHM